MWLNLRTVLILILTLGLLAFFLWNVDLGQVWLEIRRAQLNLVIAATIMQCGTYVVRAVRWQYLLLPVGRVPFLMVFRTTVIGVAVTSLLPARAGEIVRPLLLARQQGLSATATFATVVLERLLDVTMVLCLFASFLLFFDPGMGGVDSSVFQAIKVGGTVSAVGALLVLGMVFGLAGDPQRLARVVDYFNQLVPERVGHFVLAFVGRFAEGLAVIRQPMRLLVALVLSVPLWLLIASAIWLATRAFNIELPYTGSFLLMMLLAVGIAVPTPGGIGGFHAAYQLGTTTFYAVPNDQAVGAAVLLHAVSFMPVTLLGVFFMAREGLNLARVRKLTLKS